MVVEDTIYERLIAIGIIGKDGLPNFDGNIKLKSDGYMDLNIDFLFSGIKGDYVIALAHNYLQNGDVMADPDMEIKVMPRFKMAEALTFRQDGVLALNQRVYEVVDGKVMVKPRLKKELNSFLSGWLLNLKKQV